MIKVEYDHWYTIGFNDGKYNINVQEHNLASKLKPDYKKGLADGKLQRKKDKLTELVTGEKQT